MKRFNQYKLSKNDKQIIKNFEIDNNYRTLNQEEKDYYWLKILNTTNDRTLIELYSKLRWMNAYIAIINNKEYFIYDYYEKNFYNIFFYNITERKERELTTKKEDIDLFRVICSIVLDDIKYGNSLSYKIKLPTKYVKLYFKLIDKVTRKRFKNSRFIIKKINNNFYYYYKGKMHKPSMKYLRSLVYAYNQPFIDAKKLITKLKC